MLWIAEEFVQHAEGKKLEDVAEYFLDLINRSLVIPTKKSPQGGVKTCRVHDILHDCCLQKAKEGSFLQVIHVSHWSEIARFHEERRLIIKKFVSEAVKPSQNNVRSLFHTGPGFNVLGSYFSSNIENFMSLKVLDLANKYIAMSVSRIELPIHLRYLALNTNGMPASATKLWYLQSLLVQIVSFSVDLNIPSSLWNLVNLRHVRINHHNWSKFSSNELEKLSSLDNVQTLSTPWFHSKEAAENILIRVPNLKKLGCQFRSDEEYSDYENFPDLRFLEQLVSLRLYIRGSWRWEKKCEFYFPSNLEKLSLSGLLPKWEDIAEFGRNLKVLKLSCRHKYDAEWIVNDGDFPNLEYLKLSGLSICKWIASSEDSLLLQKILFPSLNN